MTDNSADTQRVRLLMALRQGPMTTHRARVELDIQCPPARILELRHLGLNIVTEWREVETQPGRKHRFAEYVLLSKTRTPTNPQGNPHA